MRILYLSASYIPSRRASSVQVMRMCEAFAGLGHQVRLIAKRFEEPTATKLDPYDFYGVEDTFALDLMPRPQYFGGEVIYSSRVGLRLLQLRRTVDLIYTRDLIGSVIAAKLGLPIVLEAHGLFEEGWEHDLWHWLVRRPSFHGLAAISNALVRELARVELLPPGKPVVVAHSPAHATGPREARTTVSTPPRVGYVGNLYRGRGVELVVALASRMPGYQFELIGGTEEDLAYWRGSSVSANVTFRGFIPPRDLPDAYRQFDVLLLPYPRTGVVSTTPRHTAPARHVDTAGYCSPMKLFEYMASGVPIVSSDLPVLQEVLTHERNALIAASDDVGAWELAIERLVRERELRVALAQRALDDLVEYTPLARAERILRGLGLS